jgi:hypothetical protein
MICHRCGWAMFFLAIRDRVLGLARARRVGSMFSTAAPLAVVICFPSDQFGHTYAGVGALGWCNCRGAGEVAWTSFRSGRA